MTTRADAIAADWAAITPERIRASLALYATHPRAHSLACTLAIAVSKHAPQMLGHIPPQFHPGVATVEPEWL